MPINTNYQIITRPCMEAIFKGRSQNGRLVFYNSEDVQKVLDENDGEDIIIEMKPESKTSQKMKMYAFYHGPLLHCAMIRYTFAGWDGIDKVKADYLLRAEFAKDFIKRPDGEYVPIMIDKRKMTKNRLLKYIQDCLLFIEIELKQSVPDSESYKASKGTGHNFKKV